MKTHSRRSSGRTGAVRTTLLLAVLFLGGCRAAVSMHVDGAYQPWPAEGLDFGMFNQTPKPRLGGLPYPGAFTLFELADPNRLGHHAYDGQTGEPEKDRGILYTCRGGFIDLAHTRKSADLCKYVAVRVEVALRNDWTALQLKGLEPSVYVIHLNYPPFWKSLTPADKQQLAGELARRIGPRVAMVMVTWHEVITWFGYKAAGILPERQSAFTYDDTGAHALGVLVGGRALRDMHHEWDQAVTDALGRALHELGVVPPAQALQAIERVREHWWSGFEPLKRQIEWGWDGRPVEAWIVRDLPFGRDATPYRFQLPQLHEVLGRDCSRLLRIDIQPNVLESDRIRAVIPGKPAVIDVDQHLPLLLDHLRRWHIQHEGEPVLRPS